MASFLYRPRLLDFLPKTRRGHGSAHFHGEIKQDGVVIVDRPQTCVQPTCSLMLGYGKDGKLRGEKHDDQKANADDWKIEHGFYTVSNKDGSVRATNIPFEECFR